MGKLPKNPAEVLVWPKAFLEAITTSSARVKNTSAENVNACKALAQQILSIQISVCSILMSKLEYF